jgi:quercetin dioxygenase-like cupin family protein
LDVFDWHSVEAQPMTGFPGVTIRWVIGPGVGAERFALRVFELQPGSEIPLHDHWYEQEMLVLAGQGTARTEHDEHAMGPGSALWVAPWERHSFAADGDEPLVFVCCVPMADVQKTP